MHRKNKIKNIRAFTLFEVLISLVILSITISGISKLFNSNNNIETYYSLQHLENEFISSQTIKETSSIKFNTKLKSN